MSNNDKLLKIDKIFINKSKYERVDEFNKSIFFDVYKQAYKKLIEIVKIQEDLKQKKIKSRNFDANNIIAFVGERGSGKTSCMKNFRRSFKEDKDNLKVSIFDLKEKGDEELSKRFELLSVIDPSLFSVKDSIIEIVVAQMFNRFKEKDDNEDVNYYPPKNIIMQFEKVYKDIRIINSNKEFIYDNNYDSLEALVSLSSAVGLKEDLSRLVDEYVKYMSNGNDGYLLISIDDIDMSLSVGEKMLEDIRKYLIIPKVIILMAVKVEQLKDIITEKYLGYLKENQVLYNQIEHIEMNNCKSTEGLLIKFKKETEFRSDKYLEKIIPFDRRISVDKLNFNDFKIEYIDDKNNNNENEKQYEAVAYIKGLFESKLKISDKDELKKLFDENMMKNLSSRIEKNEKQYISVVIPNNLRTFEALVVLLNSFREINMIEDENEKIKEFEKNKEKFIEFYKLVDESFGLQV